MKSLILLIQSFGISQSIKPLSKRNSAIARDVTSNFPRLCFHAWIVCDRLTFLSQAIAVKCPTPPQSRTNLLSTHQRYEPTYVGQ
jgi:hypothetical protein